MKRALIYSFLLISNLVYGLPQDGSVAAGSANISQSGNITTINQSSPSAVINWHSFDTVSNESVRFNQPGVNSVILNRINSGLPTNFAGNLNANGKVFIVNPAGMVFAKGSHINAASFVATTANIKDLDFMTGKYNFSSPVLNSTAKIVNNGTITARESGFVAMIAPTVINGDTGVIQANYGTVNLASGKAFVLDFNQDSLLNFDVSSMVQNGRVDQAGKIHAKSGKVILTANTAGLVFDNVINISGVIEASAGFFGKNGEVILDAKGGAIAETKTGGIVTDSLSTYSSTGVLLDSANNQIQKFSAVNSSGGDIYLRNNHALKLEKIAQPGGKLTILNTGDISQPVSTSTLASLAVTGASNFTSDGNITLSNYVFFEGPASFTVGGNLNIDHALGNLILGNSTIAGDMRIYMASISRALSQVAGSSLTVGGDATFLGNSSTTITLSNPGNKFTGYLTANNDYIPAFSFYKYAGDITLNNSLATKINTADAAGVLTITSGGKLTVSPLGYIAARGLLGAPNGHSIIISAASVDGSIYKSLLFLGHRLSPMGGTSYLIYLPTKSALNESFFDNNKPPELWNQPYSSSSPINIPKGNYLVYAEEQPKKPGA